MQSNLIQKFPALVTALAALEGSSSAQADSTSHPASSPSQAQTSNRYGGFEIKQLHFPKNEDFKSLTAHSDIARNDLSQAELPTIARSGAIITNRVDAASLVESDKQLTSAKVAENLGKETRIARDPEKDDFRYGFDLYVGSKDRQPEHAQGYDLATLNNRNDGVGKATVWGLSNQTGTLPYAQLTYGIDDFSPYVAAFGLTQFAPPMTILKESAFKTKITPFVDGARWLLRHDIVPDGDSWLLKAGSRFEFRHDINVTYTFGALLESHDRRSGVTHDIALSKRIELLHNLSVTPHAEVSFADRFFLPHRGLARSLYGAEVTYKFNNSISVYLDFNYQSAHYPLHYGYQDSGPGFGIGLRGNWSGNWR